MPKLNPETEKQRAQNLLKPLLENNLNQSKTARQLGVSQATIQEKYHRKPVQEALDEHIRKVAKRVGINLHWLLKKYKRGADEAGKVIGYLHQYKEKIKDGKVEKIEKIEKIKPDEIVSNEFIDTPDWNVRRLYLRDIAEIMKWIKQNGNQSLIDQSTHFHITNFKEFLKNAYKGNGDLRAINLRDGTKDTEKLAS